MAIQTPRLHFVRKGSLFRYRWYAGPGLGSMEFRRELSDYNLAELQTLTAQVYRMSERQHNTGPSLQEVGQALYQLVIPEELHALFERNHSPLAIYGGDPLFPWEVLHDGEQFLGMQFPMGRLPSWFEPGRDKDSGEHKGVGGEQLKIALCADPLGDFSPSQREIDYLVDSLPTRQSHLRLCEDSLTLQELEHVLSPGNNDHSLLWHISARASFHAADGAKIPLQEGSLSPQSLRFTAPHRVWAFLHLGQAPNTEHNPSAAAVSFASSLLERGVQGVVVSLRPNFTPGGRQMIGDYYQLLMEGMSPAEALVNARQRFLARNPNDPAWSSFVFFGNPGALLFETSPQHQEVSSQRSLEPAAAGFSSPTGESPMTTTGSKHELPQKPIDPNLTGDGVLEYDFDLEQAIGIALMEAKNLRQDFIRTPHLFIGLTKCPGGVTRALLESSGFEPKKVRDTIRYALGFGHASLDAKILPTQRCARALKNAEMNARKDSEKVVRERHLLAAILRSGEGLAFEVLKKMGADPQKLYDRLLRGEAGQAQSRSTGETPTIERYGRDLTQLAREGKLPPLTGRAEELMRLAQILLRRFKNNPLIIGDAGVGKTALIEGLAQRIVAGAVPEELRGRRLIELSLSSLVAGTRYRGDFEERLTQVIREAHDHPEVILFLDEFHTIVGAGETHQGTLDAANILKPSLARGELRCIGATTPTEYRRYIEKDAALERRFHPLFLEEPSVEDTLEILQGSRFGYEEHHNVAIPEEVLDLAVELAVRYLPDRRLPDKAFDLIDEACALVQLRGAISSMLTPEGKIRTLTSCPVVSENTIYKVLSDWTGIPVGEISREEGQRLLELDKRLEQRVIGQEVAVKAASEAVQLGRAGLKRDGRPTAVMMFIGPSGVGKTELCRSLANELFGDESALIRLDMSEFSEKHSSAKMLGAPPGYVGYGEDNQVLSQLHHRPYSVVLLDEIEKAHTEVLDLFLQLFEDGRLTDSLGRTVDGRHAVFILTSNVFGDRFWRHRRTLGFQTSEEGVFPQTEVERELLQHFRPEFVNRIDEIVLFKPLSEETLLQIARLRFEELAERALQQNVYLSADEDALLYLVRQSMDPAMGARPFIRKLERAVARPLSQLILGSMTKQSKDTLRVQFCLIDDEPKLKILETAALPSFTRSSPKIPVEN